MSKLYIVATPIGNLEDITLRALRILKEVDLIACEDTRVTKKLLDHYQIGKPLSSFHQHSRIFKIDFLINEIKKGKNIALVTDAGTPGISDPGGVLVAEAVKNNIPLEPIPGPSALATLISVSGIPMEKFYFYGFLPHKKGKQTIIKELIGSRYPVVFFESRHRMIKTLEMLKTESDKVNLIVGRELTKKFETIYRGNISDTIEQIKKDCEKGEFVVIVYK
ncbi:16S rRNA (cytidine(1402)-2'-O)-methyltransferase [Candidatus Parcubacteria bacterium]|nr:MAG: 16S rRNA (cytidine(1402)-2'-O)-methyltransferase [Candidatus Parcubacteria bacterium]